MRRMRGLGAMGLSIVSVVSCSVITDLSGLSLGTEAGAPDATLADVAAADVAVETAADAGRDSAADGDADAGNSYPTLVSAYDFADANDLGHDYFGTNNFDVIQGTPMQSTTVPPGHTGYSLYLNNNGLCSSAASFDSTTDHSVCWWARPTMVAAGMSQFAQGCSYDTLTWDSGADYNWRINNCNGGNAQDFLVPNVYASNTWVHICQTYSAATTTRTIVLNGKTSAKYTQPAVPPIVDPAGKRWCLGTFDGGGYWSGYFYRPMWFSSALDDATIQRVFATGCCG